MILVSFPVTRDGRAQVGRLWVNPEHVVALEPAGGATLLYTPCMRAMVPAPAPDVARALQSAASAAGEPPLSVPLDRCGDGGTLLVRRDMVEAVATVGGSSGQSLVVLMHGNSFNVRGDPDEVAARLMWRPWPDAGAAAFACDVRATYSDM